MEFTDYPLPLPTELYQQAIAAYARLVGRRAVAIYQTGSIAYPGISDLDLIVVPDRPRYDNYAYYSRHRLPPRFLAVFRHEPFILPPSHAGVLRYTTHRDLRLVHGRGVFEPPEKRDTLADLWSLLLEDYCRYRGFMDRVLRENRVSVRFLLSKLGSIRIPFRTVRRIRGRNRLPERARPGSVEAGVALRREWFALGRPAEQAAGEAWSHLAESFAQLTEQVRELLGCGPDADLTRLAYAFLRGEYPIPGVDPEAVRVRVRAFAEYLEALCRFGVFTGSLVPKTVLANDYLAWRLEHLPARPLRGIVRLKYGFEAVMRPRDPASRPAPGRAMSVEAPLLAAERRPSARSTGT